MVVVEQDERPHLAAEDEALLNDEHGIGALDLLVADEDVAGIPQALLMPLGAAEVGVRVEHDRLLDGLRVVEGAGDGQGDEGQSEHGGNLRR